MLQPFSSFTTMPSSFPKPKRPFHQNPNLNPNSCSSVSCRHSPSATLDLLILILVLFSCTFLITSSFSYVFLSLSHVLPSLLPSFSDFPIPYLFGLLLFLAASVAFVEISCHKARLWSRKCDNPKCRGLKKAMEFDVQLQTEECIREKEKGKGDGWKEIDELPWKGGQEGKNPDYECLRAELRRMAPPNGRAVLLFRARCGCPIAKLEAWGPKRGRKHKKGMANLALEGGDR